MKILLAVLVLSSLSPFTNDYYQLNQNPDIRTLTFSQSRNDSSTVTPQVSESLDSYTWKNRLILLFTPSTDHSVYRTQLDSLKQRTYALQDRDLKVLHAAGSGQVEVPESQKKLHLKFSDEQKTELYSKYDISTDSFVLLLLGKDGTVKMKRTRFTDPQEVFDRIDRMPMRQREMKRE